MQPKKYCKLLNNIWKSNLLILHFIFFVSAISAQQKFKAGVIVGLNGSQLSGDTYSGYNQPGIYGGLFVQTTLSNEIQLNFDIAFSQKGSRHNPRPEKGDFSQYYLRLNYIEIPVYVSIPIKKIDKISLELGLCYATLLDYFEEVNYFNQLKVRPFKKTEFSGFIGLGYQLNSNFKLHIRANNSILPVRNHQSGTAFRLNRGQYSSLLCFALSYQFGKE